MIIYFWCWYMFLYFWSNFIKNILTTPQCNVIVNGWITFLYDLVQINDKFIRVSLDQHIRKTLAEFQRRFFDYHEMNAFIENASNSSEFGVMKFNVYEVTIFVALLTGTSLTLRKNSLMIHIGLCQHIFSRWECPPLRNSQTWDTKHKTFKINEYTTLVDKISTATSLTLYNILT
jgi:hypothetical protein